MNTPATHDSNQETQGPKSSAWLQSEPSEPIRPPSIEFCGLSLTVGLDVYGAVDEAFAASACGRTVLTTFVNPYSFSILKREPQYAAALARFHFVLPDGIGVVWGVRLVKGLRLDRISFDTSSAALPVLERAALERRNVMLIGGRAGAADVARSRLVEAVRGLEVVAAIDGFRSSTEYESCVRRSRPDIIVCGMGAPRQEALLIELARAGAWSGLGYTCGGYFDQLADGLTYYPKTIDRLELRWLYRMYREPGRLGRRYVFEYRDYARALLAEAMRARRRRPNRGLRRAGEPSSDQPFRRAR
jgi:N-acetylglucosaminyldiphosphoundecaprenol N-acetyl-beta-D-mannosaminyltransferase